MRFEIYHGAKISVEHYHICPSCDEMWDDCRGTDCLNEIEVYCNKCYAIALEEGQTQ